MSIRRLVFWIIAFLPFIITLFILPQLPASIPAHYDIDGNVTRYGSKYELLGLPVISVAMGFFMLLVEKAAKKEISAKALSGIDRAKGVQTIKKALYYVSIATFLIFSLVQVYLIRLTYTNL